jgi:hypothetical protein
MKPWLVVAAVAAALPAVVAPSSAQSPARSLEAGAAVSGSRAGNRVRAGSQAKTRRTASRVSETPRPSAPPTDLPPGYHKVDHQTGLPNPSIPSR